MKKLKFGNAFIINRILSISLHNEISSVCKKKKITKYILISGDRWKVS